MNLGNFHSYLNPKFIELVEFINTNGFRVGVVGGIVRDFKLYGKLDRVTHDYDCELRPIKSSKNLLEEFRELKRLLSERFKTEELAFEILRILTDDFEAEISLPRIERYNGEFHHSNFTAEYIADLNYQIGFKRRDFTINAMMVEFGEQGLAFIDPLGGEEDLTKRLLKPCSNDFVEDPVRFLRALRFQVRFELDGYQFDITPEILEKFQSLKLANFSSHYLKLEMKKSHSYLHFCLRLLESLGKLTERYDEALVKSFDELILSLDKFALSDALFLNGEDLELVCKICGEKSKRNFEQMPWELRSEVNESWVKKVEYLKRLDQKIHELFYQKGMLDLSPSDLRDLSSIEVNLENVPNQERRIYKYKEQARRYFED